MREEARAFGSGMFQDDCGRSEMGGAARCFGEDYQACWRKSRSLVSRLVVGRSL